MDFGVKDSLQCANEFAKSGYPLKPCPGGDIQFCFDRPATRQVLEKDLQEAWGLWSNKLGPVGPENGHKLQFYEFIF
jgi:hypothetical protein